MNSCNHGINDVKIPPGPPPALFKHRHALTVELGKPSFVEANVKRDCSNIDQQGVDLVSLAMPVKSKNQKQQALDYKAILGHVGLVDKPVGIV